MNEQSLQLSLTIPPELAGQRLDQALAALLPDYSRSRLKAWIEAGEVRVHGALPRPRDKVFGGEAVSVRAVLPEETRAAPQEIPLALVHQDRHVFVVDKPAGLVVHPGAGNPDRTLQNALLAHDPALRRRQLVSQSKPGEPQSRRRKAFLVCRDRPQQSRSTYCQSPSKTSYRLKKCL